MPRVFITGSTDGLGRAAARALIDEGHEVVLHARSRGRASAVDDLAARSAGVVVGDLASAVETRRIADQVMRSAGWTQSSTTPAHMPRRADHRHPRDIRPSLRLTRSLRTC